MKYKALEGPYRDKGDQELGEAKRSNWRTRVRMGCSQSCSSSENGNSWWVGAPGPGKTESLLPFLQLCSLDTWFNFFKHQLLHLWNRGVILISILSWGFKDIMSWSAHHRTWYTGSTQNIGWDYDFQEAGYRWMAPPRHGKICVLELG